MPNKIVRQSRGTVQRKGVKKEHSTKKGREKKTQYIEMVCVRDLTFLQV